MKLMRTWSLLVFPLLGFAIATLAPSVAAAATYNHHWCFRFGVSPMDAGVGEDYGVTVPGQWIARGVKVLIKRGTTTKFDGFAGMGNGCIDFTDTVGLTTYSVRVYAYTQLNFNEQFRIRAWSSEANYDTWKQNQTPANLEQWYWANHGTACSGLNCSVTVTTAPDADPVANILAYATFQIHRTESQADPQLSMGGLPELHLINDDCEGGGSCLDDDDNDGDYSLAYIEEGSHRRKFLVGHEVGHWLQYQWQYQKPIGVVHNGQYVNPYLPQSIADGMHPACNSDDIDDSYLHFMRSAETQGGAFIEGFAHFLSAFAYNNHAQNDAHFKYYKSWGFLYNYDVINVESGGAYAGGVNDFLHNGCGCLSSDNNCAYYGVELDWLRHYWDYQTNGQYAAEPNISVLLEHVSDAYYAATPDGFRRDDVHEQLEDLLGGSLLQEWDASADFNGADPTPD